MKTHIKEQSVLFISVVKWIFLATIIGIIVGLSTTVFVSSLNYGARLAKAYPLYYLLAPLGLIASLWIVKYIAPKAEGHGASRVIDSVHKDFGKMSAWYVPVEFVRTFLTLTFGGSAGKEGPSAQIGAGLASIFADIFRFCAQDRRKLVICAVSGAFASVFGTPIAGAIFGIEVLFAGAIAYEVLLPSFVAGIVSYQVSSHMGLTYFFHPIEFVPTFSEGFFIKTIAAGMLFGVTSFIFVEALRLGKGIAKRLKIMDELKCLIGGAVIIAIALFFSTDYLGLGLEPIEKALSGEAMPWYAALLKAVTTSVTLAFGGSGGIGTPIFFVGALSGSAYSGILGVDPAMLSAIGFVALLAGAANTPIAASIMSVELFGAEIAPYASIACVISFVISGHRSAYSAQRLATKKSASFDVEVGGTLEAATPSYKGRDKSLIGLLSKLFEPKRPDK